MLTECLRTLNRHDVDFVVCGGVACILHGVARVTQDVDLYVNLESGNLQRFLGAAREMNLVPRIPEPLESLADQSRREAWIAEKNATVYTLNAPEEPFQVDVFLAYPIQFVDLKQRAERIELEGISFLISSKQDLIDAKRQVRPARKTDLRDIEDLQELVARERND